MTPTRKVVLARSAAVVGVLLVSYWGLTLLIPPLYECASTPSRTAIAPDGRLKAVLFERDCGATTAFSSQVSILESNQRLPNEAGNAFTADLSGDGPEDRLGGTAVTLEWKGTRSLQVSLDRSARVLTRNTHVGDVTITYKAR